MTEVMAKPALGGKKPGLYIPSEGLLDKVGSIYKICILASKRALELNEGAPRLAEVNSSKLATIALEEIRQGKVNFKEQK